MPDDPRPDADAGDRRDRAADEQAPPAASALIIAPGCHIPADEIQWRFLPSGGPGGQHANRSNTRAELRFDIEASPSLTVSQRTRLLAKIGPKLRITSDQHRSQSRNRAAALERFVERLQSALEPERTRRPTRVPRGAKKRRLENKKRRSETKQSRNWKPD